MRRGLWCLLLLLIAGAARADGVWVRPLLPGEEGRRVGVCYGPHRDGQRPGGPTPSRAQFVEDLRLMAPHWSLLRVYGASEFGEALLGALRDEGIDMKVMLGVWIAPDDSAGNRREMESGIALAEAFPEIVAAVSVGNETQVFWSSHRVDVDGLLDAVRTVRAAVTVPVTVADDFNFWNKPESRVVAAEIDFITLHAHPLWNGVTLDDALPWLLDQLNDIVALHPDRAIVIGETGWATSVGPEGEQARLIKGRAGEAEQKAFYEALRAWAEARGQTVFWFEAFDENWKGGTHPDEVEKHWGLFRADRSPKAATKDSSPR